MNLDGLAALVSIIKAKMAAIAAAIASVEAKIPAQASASNQLSLLKHPFVGRYSSLEELNKETNVEVGSMAIVFTRIPTAENSENGANAYWYIRMRDQYGEESWKTINMAYSGQDVQALAQPITDKVGGYGLVALDPSPNSENAAFTGVAATPSAVKIVYGIATGAAAKAAEALEKANSAVSADLTGDPLTASNKISDTNPPRLAAGKLQTHTVYNAGGPATYGNIVNIGGSGGGQLFLEWTGAQTAAGQAVEQGIWYRSMRDNQNAWTAWSKLSLAPVVPLATPKTLIVGRYADEGTNTGNWNGFSVNARGVQENFLFGNTGLEWCLRFASWVYRGGDPAQRAPVSFAVNGRATITVAVDHPGVKAEGTGGARNLLVLDGYGKRIGVITLPDNGQRILSFEYDGGPDGKGETLVLAGEYANINLYAVWVNSY